MKGRAPTVGAAALLLGVLTLGCGGGEAPDAAPEEPVESTQEEEADEAPSILAISRPAPDRPEIFPHGAHQRIECSTCHGRLSSHTTHADVRCIECHAVPEGFGALRTLTEAECAECHHGPEQEYTCAQCHTPASVAGETALTREMRLPVWTEAETRSLTFDHAWHAEETCTNCHATTADPERVESCGNCHEAHHEGATTACASCHTAADTTVHREAVHTGCAGSGCHADAVVSAFPPSRVVCLTCHADQVDHETGKECAPCHAIAVWNRRPLPRGSR